MDETVLVPLEHYNELAKRPKKIPGTVTLVGWVPPKGDLSYEDWYDFHVGLEITHDAINFVLGDSFEFGEHKFGEKYAQAVAVGKLHPGSYANMAWVARAIPISYRYEELSWTHHYTVAGYDLEVAVRLLGIAARRKLSVSGLKKFIERWGKIFGDKQDRPSGDFTAALPLYSEISQDVREYWPAADPHQVEDLTRFVLEKVDQYKPAIEVPQDVGMNKTFWKKLARMWRRYYEAWRNRASKAEDEVARLNVENKVMFGEILKLQAELERMPDYQPMQGEDWKVSVMRE